MTFHQVASCEWQVASYTGKSHLLLATCHSQPEHKMLVYGLLQYIMNSLWAARTIFSYFMPHVSCIILSSKIDSSGDKTVKTLQLVYKQRLIPLLRDIR